MFVAATVTAAATPARADGIRRDQWHLRALNVGEAHKVSTGENVTVGVVDTGVYPHSDLKNNLLKGSNVVSNEPSDGRVDENGHGTTVAGLIAAHGKNGDGVLGIAPAAKILPVRESSRNDNGGSASVAAGIEWAARNGADVINVSSANAPSVALNNAIATAAAQDVVVVAGSGNKPEFLQFGYPAAMEGVLAVGATDRHGEHAEFSVTGKPLQICAPGVDILSTRSNGKYTVSWGTSSSTAIASGAAALVRAKYPNLSAREVIHRLTATATDIGKPGRDDECGYGILNIVKALTAEVPPLTASTASTSAPSPPTSTPAAAPETKPSSNNTSTIAAATTAAIVLLAALTTLLLRRRRRNRRTTS
jgi:type VII secretion-associated serine protease mycosin